MQKQGISNKRPIAYFSMEFGINDDIPIYAGGLGILAGDVLKEANDLKLPIVGVGLYYNHGYFRQIINERGEQVEKYDYLPAEKVLQEATTKEGKPVIVEIPFLDKTVSIKVWKYMMGTVPLYLLDTDISKNSSENREITKTLYRGSDEMRIAQAIILGIGGELALSALNIHPSIYHLNEGHSAFSVFAITHRIMKKTSLPFQEAFEKACCTVVFTNHTLLFAGNDVFDKNLLRRYLRAYAQLVGLPIEDLLKIGSIDGRLDQFGMTPLALSISCRINAVSKLHSRLAKKTWPGVEMPGITNGVHLPSWVFNGFQQLSSDFSINVLDSLSDKTISDIHSAAKKVLIDYVNSECSSPLDEDRLTLVWARRFTSYKQPGLLFSQIDSLRRLTHSDHGALQIIISGKAHPKDLEGKNLIRYTNRIIRKEGLSSSIVFLPDYSISKAKYLTQGADVWLNTPVQGQEASGTSGMKAGANGVLQCSTRDGWVDEIPLDEIGWELIDESSAESVYEVIERSVLPLYYSAHSNGYNAKWVDKMRQTMKVVWKNYSSKRMLNEYFSLLYSGVKEK